MCVSQIPSHEPGRHLRPSLSVIPSLLPLSVPPFSRPAPQTARPAPPRRRTPSQTPPTPHTAGGASQRRHHRERRKSLNGRREKKHGSISLTFKPAFWLPYIHLPPKGKLPQQLWEDARISIWTSGAFLTTSSGWNAKGDRYIIAANEGPDNAVEVPVTRTFRPKSNI